MKTLIACAGHIEPKYLEFAMLFWYSQGGTISQLVTRNGSQNDRDMICMMQLSGAPVKHYNMDSPKLTVQDKYAQQFMMVQYIDHALLIWDGETTDLDSLASLARKQKKPVSVITHNFLRQNYRPDHPLITGVKEHVNGG